MTLYAEISKTGQMFVIAKKNDVAITSMEIKISIPYLNIVGQTYLLLRGFCGFALGGLEP